MRLNKNDFSSLVNIPNVLSPVAELQVPRGLSYIITPDTNFSMYLATREIITLAPDATGLRVLENIVPQNSITAGNLADNQKVMATWNGNITMVDLLPDGSIDITVDDNAGDIVLDYLIDTGFFQFILSAPGRADIRTTVYNDDLLGLHLTDQKKNPLYIISNELLLQDFTFSVWVDCPCQIFWQSPLTVFRSEFLDAPIEQVLINAVERGIKGDTKRDIEIEVIKEIISKWALT